MKRLLIVMLGVIPLLTASQTPKSPYAGEETREVKALSSEEIAMYMNGAGMGLAKAAELNRYPGPMHVLELAGALELTDVQREQTAALMNETKAKARELGKEIVDLERELDTRFASGDISETELVERVRAIGSRKADLRFVHLRAHLAQRTILTAEQIDRYVELRGYADED